MMLTKLIDRLEKSFWFIPTIFLILPFVILYCIFIYVLPENELYANHNLFFNIVSKPDNARLVLGAVAAAVISIISISFSITVVVLSIASQQYSPRLLQSFMRQNDTKVILGIFISTFIYCLVTIGLMQENLEYESVFTILAFVGFLLGILSLLAFVYFINYVIQTISVTNIINNVELDIVSTLAKFYPAMSDESAEPKKDNIPDTYLCTNILALETGYLQSINYDKLVNIGYNNNFIIKVLPQIGNYLIENTHLVKLYSLRNPIANHVIKLIREQFLISNERKIGDDILFPIGQMVDIAVRALSPGINDPRTAINCIDALAKTQVYLSQRRSMPSVLSKNNHIYVMRMICDYGDIVKASYRQIFENARNNRFILCHLLSTIAKLISIPSSQKFKKALIIEANVIRLYNELTPLGKNEINILWAEHEIPCLEVT